MLQSVETRPCGARRSPRGGFNHLSFYTEESSAGGLLRPCGRTQSPVSISRARWCAKRGASPFLRFKRLEFQLCNANKYKIIIVNNKSFLIIISVLHNLLKRSCLQYWGVHGSSPVSTCCKTARYWSVKCILETFFPVLRNGDALKWTAAVPLQIITAGP